MSRKDIKPFKPSQRELLRLFTLDLPESEWLELRRVIARHFSEKAKIKMDEIWDERGWTDADIERMLHDHDRVRMPGADE